MSASRTGFRLNSYDARGRIIEHLYVSSLVEAEEIAEIAVEEFGAYKVAVFSNGATFPVRKRDGSFVVFTWVDHLNEIASAFRLHRVKEITEALADWYGIRRPA